MKKLLIASTALVMTAGYAAADVRVSGDARMGVLFNDTVYDATAPGGWVDAADELSFTSRIRIRFDATGETDTGLTFGGTIRADNASNGAAGTAGSVFISGAFGRISMGDTSGAAEHVVGDLHFTSLTGLGDFNEFDYLSNASRPAMRYDYTMGDFTFALSADNPGTGAETYAVGVAYDAGMFGVALGYESDRVADADHLIGAVTASVDGIADFKLIYGTADVAGVDGDQYGISATSTFDAVTVSGYWRRIDAAGTEDDFAGIGASYDLGGGASLRGGIVRLMPDGGPNSTRADFGVGMSF